VPSKPLPPRLPKGAALFDLVRKRWAGDGWVVVPELRDHIDVSKSRGRADAVAFGLWASNKYEAHGFEFKETRADLKAELLDPSKCEHVGKFCATWWLVVRDEDLIKDLEIPIMWGILAPVTRGGREELRTVRKAKRREPAALTPGFVACLIRTALATFASPAERRELEAKLADFEARAFDVEHNEALTTLRQENARLKQQQERLDGSVTELCAHLGITRDDVTSYGTATLAKHVAFARRMADAASFVTAIAQASAAAAGLEQIAHQLAKFAAEGRSELAMVQPAGGDHHADCPARHVSRWSRAVCVCGADRSALSEVERSIMQRSPE
jgi:hypothetical protein